MFSAGCVKKPTRASASEETTVLRAGLFLRFSGQHHHHFTRVFDNRIGTIRFIAAGAVVFVHQNHAKSPFLQHARIFPAARANRQRSA